jgi:phosphate transport system substrate-binding protein
MNENNEPQPETPNINKQDDSKLPKEARDKGSNPQAEPPKKSSKTSLILIAIVLFLSVLSVFSFMFFTKTGLFDDRQQGAQSNEEESQEELALKLSEEEYPKIDASTVLHPLALGFYKNITGNQDTKLADFSFTKTHQAYERLINGEVDLIFVVAPSEDEKDFAKSKNVELDLTPIAAEAFVFFVNKDNSVDNLMLDQVQKIYAGEIKNWKEVGGKDEEIAAYQRPENSGSQTGMLDLVMKGKQMMKPKTEDFLIESMTGIVANVANGFGSGSDAIGCSYYYYVTALYGKVSQDVINKIKLLKINEVYPSNENITNKTYPLNTEYYAVIRGSSPEDSPERQVVKDILSKNGQKSLKGMGYVPIK